MFEINRANSFRLRCDLALSFAELESFIFTNVKKLTRKQFVQFPIPIRDQLVASVLLRRQHVAIRRLSEFRILLQTQSLMKMAKRLLLRNQLNMIVMRVS